MYPEKRRLRKKNGGIFLSLKENVFTTLDSDWKSNFQLTQKMRKYIRDKSILKNQKVWLEGPIQFRQIKWGC